MMVSGERAILVVDDEEGMRDWMAEILQGCGHRVFTAKDGLEARQLAARTPLRPYDYRYLDAK